MFDKVLTLIRESFIPRGAFTASDVYAEGWVPDLDMYAALDALCEEGVIIRAFDPAMADTHDRMVYVSKAQIEGKGLAGFPKLISSEDSKGYAKVKIIGGRYSLLRGFKVAEYQGKPLVMFSIFGRKCYAVVPSVEPYVPRDTGCYL